MSRPARRAGGGPGDADLLVRVRAGDRGAFEELCDRLGRRALALARRVLVDDAVAEEVLREAFLAVWRDPGAYDPASGSVRSWLMDLVHLRAVEAARSGPGRRRRPGEAPPLRASSGEEGAAGGGGPDPVRVALRALPDAEREALTLAYYGGYTQREVAALTGAPLGEVKSCVLAAVRRLHGELGAGPLGGALGSPAVAERPGR
ncbi:sigma-70 family RNA polymerase sigma factor [Geodermatophilus sabuli]|uniref:sigma-70 family RNA polymerase sigma factor n=1 Tax=Geodermatophilus sabuli TaxID=1564158 RepID=UPI0017BC83F1|nr:sigma-70 family RNA polymerase sigma factor [Geodermatophilus sabuli]MBB3081978.1 RNA polymerase sigma-70 factor (ECF subfamily) [Geodermatophilus sabuli]